MRNVFYLLLLTGWVAITGCGQIDVYEYNKSIPNYEWKQGYAAQSSFEITDTISAYNVYIVLRHTDAYNYNNIWLNVGIKAPGDSLRFQKVDLPLGTDAGGWDGTGMNDIWEVRKPLALNKRFIKSGQYHFSIFHIMREEPLKAVMSAGLRVEKVK